MTETNEDLKAAWAITHERCDWAGTPDACLIKKARCGPCILVRGILQLCAQAREAAEELSRRAVADQQKLFLDLRAAEKERDKARRFGEDAARKYNDLLATGRILTCAFCGQAYPEGTPETKHERLTAHVMVCIEHPMRVTEARLREMEQSARQNDDDDDDEMEQSARQNDDDDDEAFRLLQEQGQTEHERAESYEAQVRELQDGPLERPVRPEPAPLPRRPQGHQVRKCSTRRLRWRRRNFGGA